MKKNINLSKICIISDCFVPKKISAAGMIYNLASIFVQNQVKVICLFGTSKEEKKELNNPDLKTYNLTNIKIISTTFMNYLRSGSYFSRFVFEVILALSLSVKILCNKKLFCDVDLIIWYSPSSFLWLPALILKFLTKSPLYLILRDIFPNWLVNIGVVKNTILIKFLEVITLPQFLLPNIIGCESKSDAKFISNKIKNKKVTVLYNWPSLNSKIFHTNAQDLEFVKYFKNNQNKDYIFGIYTGNDSISHDLRSGVDFLRRFSNINKINQILTLNRFSTKSYVRPIEYPSKMIENNWNMVPDYRLSEIYKNSDFGIVSLNLKHKTNNLPGKFVSYLQYGLPILSFTLKTSDLGYIINLYKCGCVIDLNDNEITNYKKLKTFLLNFKINKSVYSQNSKKLFDDFFSINSAFKNITKDLESLNKKNLIK